MRQPLHITPPAGQSSMPMPLVIGQLRAPAGLEQACEVGPTAPQTAESVGVQLCELAAVPHAPMPGLPVGVQACEVGPTAPQTPGSVGVQPCDVTSVPQLVGVDVGVQPWVVTGRGPQSASATTFPRSSVQVMVRVCEPEPAVQTHAAERVCVPLPLAKAQLALRDWTPELPTQRQLALRVWAPEPGLKLQLALRDSVPEPLHTALAVQPCQPP
jgi:hypothetical protein